MKKWSIFVSIIVIIFVCRGYVICGEETLIYGTQLNTNLNYCKTRAVENSTILRIASEQINLARMRTGKAFRGFFPDIRFQWKEDIGETITDPYIAENYGIRVIQPLFGFGSIGLNYHSEMLGLKSARINYEKVRRELRLEVSKAYWNVVRQKMKVSIWSETIEQIKPYALLAEREYRVEGITKLEFGTAKLVSDEANMQLRVAENELEVAWLALRQTMDIDPFSDLVVDSEFRREIHGIPWTLEQCKKMALANSPQVKAAEVVLSLNDYRRKSVNATRWPQLSLEVGAGRSGEAYTTEPLDLVGTWSVMGRMKWFFWGNTLGFSYDESKTNPTEIVDTSVRTHSRTNTAEVSLLDSLAVSVNRREAEVVYRQAKDNLKNTRDKAILEITNAYRKYQNAMERVILEERRAELSENRAKIVTQQKMIDERTTSDVMQAILEVARARSLYTDSMYEYYVALSTLESLIHK